MRDSFLDGPADLVIEIVSPGRGPIDLVTKRAEYDYGHVGEYWVIDPFKEIAVFFCRQGEDSFVEANADEDGWFTSARLSSLHLQVGWLWSHDVLSEAEIETSWALRDRRI